MKAIAMIKLSLFFDKKACVKCYACLIACKMVHNYPPYPVSPPLAAPQGVSLLRILEYGPMIHKDKVNYHFQPITCKHCADPPCIKECPQTAIFKDPESGITLTDRENCIGCQLCLQVCPFNAPVYDADGKIALCDMCIARLKDGKKTACQSACPAGAIFVGTANEISAFKDKSNKKGDGMGTKSKQTCTAVTYQ